MQDPLDHGAAWNRVKEILATALEMPPEERTPFIRRSCAGDAALLAEVESLLEHSDRADSLLENVPAGRSLFFESSAWTGKMFGPYRIARALGEGGMAVVFLGERDDQQFRRRVAIKMLRPGVYTAEIVQRFRNERQTLAALDHPHIVKLLDGGSTSDGLPYLVMDYVDGLPVDEYCRSRRLSIPSRLQLFLEVCSAVEYAHRNGVIHRDLKPGNILITHEGVPRLLDFGIAKLLNPELLQTALVTRTELRPMTIEYASPEQVRGSTVTEASDIYSLGVVLYELLTGRRPFLAAGHSRSEFERIICEEDPERPSKASVDPAAIAGHSATQFRRALEGDLDTIVLKALSKEPQYRYSSVGDFSADIQRHLSGMPVKARTPTLSYRSTRFMRRHKESFATALLALILVSAIGGWQMYRVLREKPAGQSRGAVAARARPSIAVFGFKNLSGSSETAWISTALSEMLTAQLASGEELRSISGDAVAQTKINLNLSDVEGIPANVLEPVRRSFGTGYVVVGSYLEETGSAGQHEVRLDARLLDTSSGQTVAADSERGSETELAGLVSRIGGRFRERLGLSKISEVESQGIAASAPSSIESLRLYSQGLTRLRAFDVVAASDLLTRAVAADPSFPLAHSALATVWRTMGHDADARDQAKQALDAAGNLPRETHLLLEAGYYEAITNWSKAIETYAVLTSFFPDSVEYRIDLANAKSSGGHAEDAIRDLTTLSQSNPQAQEDPRIDLAIAQAGLSSGNSKLRRDAAEQAAAKAERQGARLLVARARTLECRALANLGENSKAAIVCEEARRIFTDTGNRGELARVLHSMAEVPLNQGDLASAGNLYTQALAILREIGNQRGIGSELLNLGLISIKRGDLAAGLNMYQQALRSYQQAGDKPGMAAAMGNLGNLQRSQGKLAEALANYRQTLALSEELGHRSSVGMSYEAMGLALIEQGDLPGAARMFQQSLDIQHDIGEKSNYANSQRGMGRVLMFQGRLEEARKLFEQALSSQEQLGERGSAAETQVALAELDCDSGRADQAEQLARAALKAFQDQHQSNDASFAAALLSRALLEQAKLNDAAAALEAPLHLAPKSLDLTTRLAVDLAHAKVLASTKHTADAERLARRVVAETPAEMFRMHLEASLALAEIEGSRQALEKVAAAARAKGFELIARRAGVAVAHALVRAAFTLV